MLLYVDKTFVSDNIIMARDYATEGGTCTITHTLILQ